MIKGYILLERVTHAWQRSSSYRWLRENGKVKYFKTPQEAKKQGGWQVYMVTDKLSNAKPIMDEDIESSHSKPKEKEE